jgi:hypothetical protein
LILVLACVLVLAACERELTMRERAVEEEMVEERFNTWVRLVNNARVDSLLLLYHQVPTLETLWPDGRRTTGYEELKQNLREFYQGISYMNFVPQNPEFQVLTRDLAVATFRHSTDIVLANGDRQPVASGLGTLLWMKDSADNLWKIHVEQVAVSAPRVN